MLLCIQLTLKWRLVIKEAGGLCQIMYLWQAMVASWRKALSICFLVHFTFFVIKRAWWYACLFMFVYLTSSCESLFERKRIYSRKHIMWLDTFNISYFVILFFKCLIISVSLLFLVMLWIMKLYNQHPSQQLKPALFGWQYETNRK